jgi:hypothetical protein
MHSRHELSAALSKSGCYQSEYRLTDNVREVSATTPKHTWGIVIHRQFFVSPNITNNMCLECTFLDSLGDAHQTFQKYLFTSECISAYLTRSKFNVVVCELEDSRIRLQACGICLSRNKWGMAGNCSKTSSICRQTCSICHSQNKWGMALYQSQTKWVLDCRSHCKSLLVL